MNKTKKLINFFHDEKLLLLALQRISNSSPFRSKSLLRENGNFKPPKGSLMPKINSWLQIDNKKEKRKIKWK